MAQESTTKMNAIALISMATGRGRKTIEGFLKQMTDAGLIHPVKMPYANAILYSQADIEAVIAAIKQEAAAQDTK